VLRKPGQSINVKVPTDVALYILNGKRVTLSQLEAKYGLSINIMADDHLVGSHFLIEKGEPRIGAERLEAPQHVRVDSALMDEVDDDVVEPEDDAEEETVSASPASEEREEGDGTRRRRRRRRGRGGERGDDPRQPQPQRFAANEVPQGATDEAGDDEAETTEPRAEHQAADGTDEPRRRRRRGRRGGRRNRREGEDMPGNVEGAVETNASSEEEPAIAAAATGESVSEPSAPSTPEVSADAEIPAEADAEKPRRGRRKRAVEPVEATSDVPPAEIAAATAPEAPAAELAADAKPKRTRTRKAKADAGVPAAEPVGEAPQPAEAAAAPPPVVAEAVEEAATPRRRRKELPADGIIVSSTAPAEAAEGDTPKKKAGWWQRGFFGS
jgi:ribonuclease E